MTCPRSQDLRVAELGLDGPQIHLIQGLSFPHAPLTRKAPLGDPEAKETVFLESVLCVGPARLAPLVLPSVLKVDSPPSWPPAEPSHSASPRSPTVKAVLEGGS